MELDQKEAQLEEILGSFDRAVVAFSGGVDSSLLAFIANRILAEGAHCVTALSPAVSELQRRLASEFATRHQLNHHWVETNEMEDENYTSNPTNRCYFCKSELFGLLQRWGSQRGISTILDGSNADDVHDYRPGRKASAERAVRSPLLEAGLSKEEIRALSQKWNLSTADLPAMPCLSSRFPYGVAINEEKLRQVDRAESFLRSLGFVNFRVRHHETLARLEIDQVELPRVLNPTLFRQIDEHLRSLGYLHVTLDLRGFRSGSLNQVVQLDPAS